MITLVAILTDLLAADPRSEWTTEQVRALLADHGHRQAVDNVIAALTEMERHGIVARTEQGWRKGK